MKTVLVTGGAGFIGSNFVRYMLNKYPDYKIINVDALTYAGNLENLIDISDNPNYVFIKVDIRDRENIDGIFTMYPVDSVTLACRVPCDRSIEEPEVFLTTNVIGTHVLLDVAKTLKVNPDDKYCKNTGKGLSSCRYRQTKYTVRLVKRGCLLRQCR